MAIRVTQHTMYNNMVGHMQQNLAGYMESVQQGSSQKKINRPSDDPAGTYRVLTTRNDMVGTEQYQENVDTAKGWLNLADQVLSTNVTTAIKGLKTLAEQASTGHYTPQQRLIMADEARQYFGQLLNLSNTQFEDKHLFAGHKYSTPAFQEGLAATSWDDPWANAIEDGQIEISGASERSVMIQFTESGPLYGGMEYKWTNDAGVTWHTDKVQYEQDDKGAWCYMFKPTGSGVTMTVPVDMDKLERNPDYTNDPKGDQQPYINSAENPKYNSAATEGPESVRWYPPVLVRNPDFKEGEEENDDNQRLIPLTVKEAAGIDEEGTETENAGAKNGTFITIRPTAIYMGDDKDPPVDVTLMGAGEIANRRSPDTDGNPVQATGSFGANMLVRIDGHKNETNGKMEDVNLFGPSQEFEWSYSTDGGVNWITARGRTNGNGSVCLPVPGGYIDYDLAKDDNGKRVPADNTNGGFLYQGMQANIHPSRSDLNYEIMKDTYLSVNAVGKDIFGGYYDGKPAMDDNDYNLFEVVGSFIGYLEANNQEGCQRTLATLTKAEEKILKEATRVGGMENRVSMAADVLSFQKIDQQERLSYTEDVDLTELLTRLTRQQLTYQTVLQSSSMIMTLSLANYV